MRDLAARNRLLIGQTSFSLPMGRRVYAIEVARRTGAFKASIRGRSLPIGIHVSADGKQFLQFVGSAPSTARQPDISAIYQKMEVLVWRNLSADPGLSMGDTLRQRYARFNFDRWGAYRPTEEHLAFMIWRSFWERRDSIDRVALEEWAGAAQVEAWFDPSHNYALPFATSATNWLIFSTYIEALMVAKNALQSPMKYMERTPIGGTAHDFWTIDVLPPVDASRVYAWIPAECHVATVRALLAHLGASAVDAGAIGASADCRVQEHVAELQAKGNGAEADRRQRMGFRC